MDVLAVSKDPGGTAGILPVVRELQLMGLDVGLLANGKAVEIFYTSGELFFACNDARRVAGHISPRVFLTSMCSDGGVGRDLVPIYRACGIPTIALQDFWGAGLTTIWNETIYRPDYICVNDEVGKDAVRRAWPEFSDSGICVLGYPALDKYATYDVRAIGHEIRRSLGLDHSARIVLFTGDVSQTASVLWEIVRALQEMRFEGYLIARPHPRMRSDDPAEAKKWDETITWANSQGWSFAISDASGCGISSLIVASDVVCSAFSTTLVEAAVLRKPAIAVLYPETMRMYQTLIGEVFEEFPLVSLGCSAKAIDQKTLRRLLKSALDGNRELIENQERTFHLDGQNAHRVAAFVYSCLERS